MFTKLLDGRIPSMRTLIAGMLIAAGLLGLSIAPGMSGAAASAGSLAFGGLVRCPQPDCGALGGPV